MSSRPCRSPRTWRRSSDRKRGRFARARLDAGTDGLAGNAVRNVDARLKERLRVRAARHGRSMEAEFRHILDGAPGRDAERGINLAKAIRRRFEPPDGAEPPAHPPVPVEEPPRFE